jgi:flap endonuclease-1
LGVDLGSLVQRRKVSFEELSRRTYAVDAYNALYQFLAIIRGPTGAPLMDREGRVTSHLSGLLYRTTNLAERGIRLVYVFDGKAPSLKDVEIKRRQQVKQEATVKYEVAVAQGAYQEAKKYAQATGRLRDTMLDDSKKLLELLGVPWIQAPSEGEAQAAYMAAKGAVWSAVSQDYDALLFGAPRLVRNLTISGKRKLPMRQAYVQIDPEFVELESMLRELGLSREQLVDLGILVGTDFNPGGFRGIGPKTALKLIKEHGNLEEVSVSKPEIVLPSELKRIREIFLRPDVTDDYKLDWKEPDIESLVAFLCGERDFDEERVRGAVSRAVATKSVETSKGEETDSRREKPLEAFFGSPTSRQG